MCGIAGIVNLDGKPVERRALEAMTAALHHRGPDAGGVWTDAGAATGLGHRRLAVIDLATGAQPMSLPDAALTITFNGEIYNFRELRARLEAAGHTFRTRSDTEVLLHLYATEGPAMLERLDGMFAFAIWDARRRELFLARDRLGKKPLAYAWTPRRFAFASELHALRFVPGLPLETEPEAVLDYLTWHCIPAPRTIWRGVRKLPPGCHLTLRADATAEPAPVRWWQLRFEPAHAPDDAAAFQAAAERLRAELEAAVARRLVADVPLGAFLSGGLDSAIVTGLMARRLDGPVKTFTIGFRHRAYDERTDARLTAALHRTEHHERLVEPFDFAAARRLARHAGEPFADASILPTFLLAAHTRGQVTVALSGDGADELFGGYDRYRAMRFLRAWDRLPSLLRTPHLAAALRRLFPAAGERSAAGRLQRLLRLLPVPPEDRYAALMAKISDRHRHQLCRPRLRACPHAPEDHLASLYAAATTPEADAHPAETDLHSYLPDDILVKVDIAAMSASLEVRSPFLDHHLAEFAATLPWSWKQHGRERKRILLAAAGDLVPPPLRQRPKRGFGVPLASWFRGGWGPRLQEVLLDPAARSAAWFDPGTIERLFHDHTARRADHGALLWALLMFELWAQEQPA